MLGKFVLGLAAGKLIGEVQNNSRVRAAVHVLRGRPTVFGVRATSISFGKINNNLLVSNCVVGLDEDDFKQASTHPRPPSFSYMPYNNSAPPWYGRQAPSWATLPTRLTHKWDNAGRRTRCGAHYVGMESTPQWSGVNCQDCRESMDSIYDNILSK